MLKASFSFPSEVLHKKVNVVCQLPYSFLSKFEGAPVLWCLHPAMEDGDFFFEDLQLQNISPTEKFAFIAPSLGNGYFINTPVEKQADFLDLELFPVMRSILPISQARESNFLFGISMGAFGASRWALRHPEHFSKVALVSGIFDYELPLDPRARKDRQLKPLVRIFSDQLMPVLMLNEGIIREDAKLRFSREVKDFPEFGLWTGDTDYLSLDQTKFFLDFCHEHNIRAQVEYLAGKHDITLWKMACESIMAWLQPSN